MVKKKEEVIVTPTELKGTEVVNIESEQPKDIIRRENILTYLDAFGLTSQLTKQEAEQFIQMATAFQLNPFKREIYCVPYMSNVQNEAGEWAKVRKLSVITGYEVYTKRAERTGKLMSWNVTTEGTGVNIKAIITILRRDWKEPFIHEVEMSEYNTGKSLWKTKPKTMLKKVAIAQGFRLAFPEDIGGMPYTSDELPENMTAVPLVNIKQIEASGDSEVDKKEIEKENAKREAAEKLNALPDNIKQGFDNLDYNAKAQWAFCVRFGWDNAKIMAEINKVIDSKAAITIPKAKAAK
jgi:phage recombination protein Bet